MAINSVSGAVEVVDQSEVSANVGALPDRSEPASAAEDVPSAPSSLRKPLFATYDDELLTGLGVLPSLLLTNRKITTARSCCTGSMSRQ